MFRIKICGITNLDDAQAAVDAGADAIGLNFFSKSSRFVVPATARQIAMSLPATVTKVGVFVNHAAEEIARIVDDVGLNCIQLHGDERPNFLLELPAGKPVVRAVRPSGGDFTSVVVDLAVCRLAGRIPDALLVDAEAPGTYGGAGRVSNWEAVVAHRAAFEDMPLILAGGLTPENVARAIKMVRPDGVDVASGVEFEPGRKLASRMIEFINAAREAFGYN